MSSTTVTQLINLLTRPLILTHPAIQIAHLQLALQANLPSFLPTDTETASISPFTLHLTSHSLPVTPIYAACLSSGISWDSWISALSAGKEMYVFVMEGCIRVGVQGRDVVTVWKKDDEELRDEQVPKISKISKGFTLETQAQTQPSAALTTGHDYASNTNASTLTGSAPSPMTIKLQAMLDSVRNRKRSSLVAGEPQPIQLPTLPALSPVDLSSDNEDDETMSIDSAPASIVPVLSVATSAVIVAVASAPCSPVTTSARLVPISSSSSDDEAESDTESDTESTTSSTSSTSSRFSSRSAESMTSVSSGGSNTAFGKPFFPTSLTGVTRRSISGPSSFVNSALRNRSFPRPPLANDSDVIVVDSKPSVQAEEHDQPLHPVQLAKVTRDRAQRDRRQHNRPTQAKSSSVPVNKPKADLTKYMYQGGQTGVITGGVMLGSASASKQVKGTSKGPANPNVGSTVTQVNARVGQHTRTNGNKGSFGSKAAFQQKGAAADRKVILGPDASDWRRRV
ncbi:hypothetical protein K435DRAFT_800725 [Dendrothele bispora CBS 962.96]|uniref:Anti-proliferative protein domain-containing protein n=1 Tax=Dendrothele bispora (strain CBS 962.96) TaxID=1314807 RepID=A0A4S8LRN5_DENBC|nr:hypothetical protein K435DRAFT_800725 [Dendrothele bispora CBS 962.96]